MISSSVTFKDLKSRIEEIGRQPSTMRFIIEEVMLKNNWYSFIAVRVSAM